MSIVEYKRLHVTPLTPDLLPVVLGGGLLSSAQNIAYHTITTFPENSYGFLDLPTAAAAKLSAKLNGAILRGRKMKIEEARPSKRRRLDSNQESEVEETKPATRSSKAKDNVLTGRELSPDRKVKRGWTEPKTKSKDKKTTKFQQTSKYTEKEELLFKTQIPENKKESKSRDAKKRKQIEADVVHEFAKTTVQPKFLRSSGMSTNTTAAFVEGRGWVDTAGEVIEAEPKQSRPKPNHVKSLQVDTQKAQQKTPAAVAQRTDTVKSESPERESEDTSDDVESTSSSGSSTSESAHSSDDSEASASTQQSALQTPAKVHPLEALFKKPYLPGNDDIVKPSLELETGFSFFGQDAMEDDEENLEVPATPFTMQDVQSRGTRSAAPTPDTAHPSRFNSFERSLSTRSQANRDSSIDSVSPVKQSDFEKSFWENRGENNRAWKARRRAALKEQRQKENKNKRSN